jgi:hypothetical protein
MNPAQRKAAFLTGIAIIAALALTLSVLAGCGKKKPSSTGSKTTAPTIPAGDYSAPSQPSTTPGTTPTQPGSEEEAVVTQAAIASARANNPSLGELDVVAVKIVDGWARVDLQPSDRSTDAASWLLRKEGGAWRLVDFGTSILPSDHPDAPSGVFN